MPDEVTIIGFGDSGFVVDTATRVTWIMRRVGCPECVTLHFTAAHSARWRDRDVARQVAVSSAALRVLEELRKLADWQRCEDPGRCDKHVGDIQLHIEVEYGPWYDLLRILGAGVRCDAVVRGHVDVCCKPLGGD
jgi:hypothetical protein